MKIIKAFILFIICFFSVIEASAQQLDGFKYAWVETLKYTDGSTDKYGISGIVRKAFAAKGLKVIYEEEMDTYNSSPELRYVVFVYINHTFIYDALNTITLTLKDCFDRDVITLTGQGLGFTPSGTFSQATRRAMAQVRSYKFNPEKSPKMDIPGIEMTDWNEEKLRHYYDSCSSNLAYIEGIYKSVYGDFTSEMRFGIYKDGYKYKAVILETKDIRWKPGEVKAIFEDANSLYSVKWFYGNKTTTETFARWAEGGILEIGFGKEKGSSHFVKIYPLSSSTSSVKPNPAHPARPSNQAIASGTGFVISKDGYIATNAHVIEGANRITVDLLDSNGLPKQYEAISVVSDAKNDVAIIKIEDESFKDFKSIPYTLEPRANIGAEVFTIGFPLNSIMGENYKVANGIISAKTGINDNISEYQITVPIQPGNSGGPLINKDGNIVGITSAGLNGDAIGTHVENVNYAVKILYLMNAINAIPKMEEMPENSSTKGLSMEKQIEIIKDYICLIKIY